MFFTDSLSLTDKKRNNRFKHLYDFLDKQWENVGWNYNNVTTNITPYSKNENGEYEIEVPGFTKNDLNITLKLVDGSYIIHITGEKKNRNIDTELILSSHLTHDDISARCEDGILYVDINNKDGPDEKKIEIK